MVYSTDGYILDSMTGDKLFIGRELTDIEKARNKAIIIRDELESVNIGGPILEQLDEIIILLS